MTTRSIAAGFFAPFRGKIRIDIEIDRDASAEAIAIGLVEAAFVEFEARWTMPDDDKSLMKVLWVKDEETRERVVA